VYHEAKAKENVVTDPYDFDRLFADYLCWNGASYAAGIKQKWAGD